MAGLVFTPTSPLGDALVILGVAGVVIPVFARLRITPVIGFILVGIAVGPFGLGALVPASPWLAYVTISHAEALQPIAEFGIILLLFSVGLELSFVRLWAMRRQVFGLGALELFGCALLLAGVLAVLGQAPASALGIGLALAMSSTALVLPIVRTETPLGRAALSMLLFEDLALVPILFVLGALSPATGSAGLAGMIRTLGLGLLVIGALMVFGRLLLPRLFAQAARTKSPEMFLSASLLVVIVAALATASVGLSAIVGALIAGLLIAETEYHTEVETMTAPFKGLALGIFLITVGMEIDPGVIARQAGPIVIATVAVLLIKAGVTSLLLRLTGSRLGIAAEAGLLLASPSETTLIVLAAASGARLVQPETAQFWQAITAIGMTITPILAWLGRRLARRIEEGTGVVPEAADGSPRTIIIGFGRAGRMVAQLLRSHGKPFIGVDSNPDLIAAATAEGYAAAFGNASRSATLASLGVDRAAAVILTMDEPVAVLGLTRNLHRKYADLPIIARARDTAHAAALYRAGATHVVPDTLEASLQLAEAALVGLGVPIGHAIASIHEVRDTLRDQIRSEADLAFTPQLKTSARPSKPPVTG